MITRPPESLLTLVCTSTFIVSVVAGCGSDSKTESGADSGSASDSSIPEQTKSSPSLSYHEHGFAQDKNLVATPSTSLVVNLEHPDETSLDPRDSGGAAGVDVIPIQYSVQAVHSFCWPGNPGVQPPHVLTLTRDDGSELVRVEEGGACLEISVPVGLYRMVLRHGGARNGASEAVFIRPAPEPKPEVPVPTAVPGPPPAPAPGQATPTCLFLRTATKSTMNLQPGEAAVFAQNIPVDSSIASVFGGNCDDLSPFVTSTTSVATGPNTMAMLYHSAQFSGAMAQVNSLTPADLSARLVVQSDHQFTNTKGSIRVWNNAGDLPSSNCQVSRAGLVGESGLGDPVAGEIALYSQPDYAGFVVMFTGSCADLNTICFAGDQSNVKSLKVGDNMVATVYADVSFAGNNWAYNTNAPTLLSTACTNAVGDAGLPSACWKSVLVETMAVHNVKQTLITTNNCTSCMLQSAKLQGAHLPGAILTGADLRGADLTGAVLTGANLKGAFLQGAWMNDVDMQNAVASNANFRGAFLIGANLKGAQLDGAFFNDKAPYPAAHLDYAYLPNANLSNASLSNATMTYVDLYGASASVVSATMAGTDLTNANLASLNLAQVHLEGAMLTGAVLINADLHGAFLTNAKLIGAHLEGANFDGANLSGANLTHAVVAFTAGSYTSQVLVGDDTQTSTTLYPYGATSLASSTTNSATTCPIGYYGPCDSQKQWTVDSLNRPALPPCIPKPNEFCPRKAKSH